MSTNKQHAVANAEATCLIAHARCPARASPALQNVFLLGTVPQIKPTRAHLRLTDTSYDEDVAGTLEGPDGHVALLRARARDRLCADSRTTKKINTVAHTRRKDFTVKACLTKPFSTNPLRWCGAPPRRPGKEPPSALLLLR